MPEEPGGELVEEGSFRVDRSRLLEKLQAFQLKEPKQFMTPFLRCAAASGATRAEARDLDSPPGFEIRFDGRPFTRGELQDPYQCLLEKEKLKLRRNRQLAYGLLAALRLKPKAVTVLSGKGTERIELRARSLREEEFIPPEPGEDTVIRVRWSRWPKEFSFRSPCKVFTALNDVSDCLLPVTFGDWTTEPPSSAGKRPGDMFFKENAICGRVRRAELEAGTVREKSLVRLQALGVGVESLELDSEFAPVDATFNDDAFRLDVSQSSIVRDERYDRVKAIVKRWARELLKRELDVQAARMPQTGKLLLDPALLPYWKARLAGRDAWAALQTDWLRNLRDMLPAALTPAWLARRRYDLPPGARELHFDGLRTLWLRKTAEMILPAGQPLETQDELGRRLWDVPLFFDARGEGLSLKQAHAFFEPAQRLFFVRAPLPGAVNADRLVWITSSQDEEFLSRWFRLAFEMPF
ncbi:MAG TPA: hypothetical protein DCM05_06170 [Elusimicrobia bacterium]|nr:hypothetical protein [Elusimicrobiota bacterium]